MKGVLVAGYIVRVAFCYRVTPFIGSTTKLVHQKPHTTAVWCRAASDGDGLKRTRRQWHRTSCAVVVPASTHGGAYTAVPSLPGRVHLV